MVGRADPTVYDWGMEPSNTHDLNALSLPDFADFLRQSGYPRRLIELARDEDLSSTPHDWTGELMFAPSDQRRVQMRSRAIGIIAGIEFLPDLIEVFSPLGQIQCKPLLSDGDEIDQGRVIAELTGNARAIVAIERTMLNLFSRMSGIATHTNAFVTLAKSTNAQICDTRKTTPGLRAFEKYSVRCGGGTTHRMGLFDALLIKDNHLAGINNQDLGAKIESAVRSIRGTDTDTSLWFVQVEVDRLDQLGKVLEIKPGLVDMVLLDNMTTDELHKAVAMRNEIGSSMLLEASGSVTIDTVGAIAHSGVDRISIGGLTHQAQSIDLGFDAI